eukprot:TRINITY_DN1518_c0_g1_i9.p1 TRINITY_DN1518_c0_g1~~TRINITY_DN1518_c0_g1_i9.p1  ORF type:complete len:131 (+),score=14.29 TRINITY_DN1518_c0_g1_i9:371-763(+)
MQEGLDETKLAQIFALYDVDHDGSISWNEYVACVVIIYQGNFDDKLSLIFNAFDQNLDQKISRREFGDAVDKFCLHVQETQDNRKKFVESAFTACDSDNNGVITLSEFKNWTQRDPETFKVVAGLLAADL